MNNPSATDTAQTSQWEFPTLPERILKMTPHELEELASGEALAIADSSRLEGLVLDQTRIRDELLNGYLFMLSQHTRTTQLTEHG